jgi:N-acetylglucosamine transport system substrate-binding protein
MRNPLNRYLILAFFVLAAWGFLAYRDYSSSGPGPGKERVLDIMFYQGGYGVEFFKLIAAKFEEAHPGVRVSIWSSPRISEKIRLRLLSDDPPDLIYPDGQLERYRVVKAGLIHDLSKDLAGEAYPGSGPWATIFYPSVLEIYHMQNAYYSIPFFLITYVCWYNAKMFREHGWQPPQTWEEMLTLCAAIKAAGIAPMALQGRYISYLQQVYFDVLDRMAPPGFFAEALLLKPGIWKEPVAAEAARRVQDLFRLGYFQPGCLGMSHTEAQMEFQQGRAAMVWCGTWLPSEMQNTMPPGFEYSCFATPAVTGGRGAPGVLTMDADHFFVCEKGKNRDLAVEFLKFMCRPEIAAVFVKEQQALTSLPRANAAIPANMQEVVKILDRAPYFKAPEAPGRPYPAFNRTMFSLLTELVLFDQGTGKFNLTPEEFGQQMEEKAEGMRRGAGKK